MKVRVTACITYTCEVGDKMLSDAAKRYLKKPGGNSFDDELLAQLLPVGFTLVEDNENNGVEVVHG